MKIDATALQRDEALGQPSSDASRGAPLPAQRLSPSPQAAIAGTQCRATVADSATPEGEIAASGSPQSPYQVVCISAGHGFPLIGSSARIVTVGNALQAAGIDFQLLHFGPSPAPTGTRMAGVYRGVPFQYTCATRPANVVIRWFVYSWALARLTLLLWRLKSSHRRFAIYLYVMDGPVCLYLSGLCRLLGYPVVQEMCEWFPSRPTCHWFTRWLYRKPIFALATGVLVISRLIEHRVQERAAAVNPHLLVHRLTSIVDSDRFASGSSDDVSTKETIPHFLWCGVGYREDVHFIVRALAVVNREGYRCKLRIISANYLTWRPEQIVKYAVEQGLSVDDLVFMGRVDDRTLEACYKSAIALLLPLHDDDQSRTRMPNKLPEYMASGRPIITCRVGDLVDFLEDGVNAHVARAGAEREFADRMILVLRDPVKADQIGAAGQKTCLAQLDYRAHAETLAKFFVGCIEHAS